MAIIFISPRKRQIVVITAISFMLVAALIAVGVFAFSSEILALFEIGTFDDSLFNPREVNVNFSVVDSDQVKNLNAFEGIQGDIPSGRSNPFVAY